MCKHGQTGLRDTLLPELGIIDFISEHDEATYQQLAGNRHHCFRFTAPDKEPDNFILEE